MVPAHGERAISVSIRFYGNILIHSMVLHRFRSKFRGTTPAVSRNISWNDSAKRSGKLWNQIPRGSGRSGYILQNPCYISCFWGRTSQNAHYTKLKTAIFHSFHLECGADAPRVVFLAFVHRTRTFRGTFHGTDSGIPRRIPRNPLGQGYPS